MTIQITPTTGKIFTIDVAGIPLLGGFKWRWFAKKKNKGNPEIARVATTDGKEKVIYLKRLLTGAEATDNVYFRDGDKSNLTRSNLMVIPKSEHARYMELVPGLRQLAHPGRKPCPSVRDRRDARAGLTQDFLLKKGRHDALAVEYELAYKEMREASALLGRKIQDVNHRNKRRMQMSATSDCSINAFTISAMFKAQDAKCVYCGCSILSEYHIDHINPIATGGSHVISNVQLLCPDCNMKKSSMDNYEYQQTRGLLF